MSDFLYFAEWHLDDGRPYLQLYNTKKQALIHAKRCSTDTRFGGRVRVLSRAIGCDNWETIATFTDGKKTTYTGGKL
jgi:hypothetical protein